MYRNVGKLAPKSSLLGYCAQRWWSYPVAKVTMAPSDFDIHNKDKRQMLRDTEGQIIEQWMRISRTLFYRKVAGKHGVPVAYLNSIRRIWAIAMTLPPITKLSAAIGACIVVSAYQSDTWPWKANSSQRWGVVVIIERAPLYATVTWRATGAVESAGCRWRRRWWLSGRQNLEKRCTLRVIGSSLAGH